MFQSTPQTPTSGQDGVTGTRFTLLPQQPGKNTAQSIRNGFKDNEHQARMVILERQETNMDNPSTAPADCLESLQTTGTQRGNSGRIQAAGLLEEIWVEFGETKGAGDKRENLHRDRPPEVCRGSLQHSKEYLISVPSSFKTLELS